MLAQHCKNRVEESVAVYNTAMQRRPSWQPHTIFKLTNTLNHHLAAGKPVFLQL